MMPQKQISVTIDIPEWANWVAQDYDGDIYFYEEDPTTENDKYWNVGVKNTDMEMAAIYVADVSTNWQNSKIDLRENDFEIVNGELVAIPKMKDLPEMLKDQA